MDQKERVASMNRICLLQRSPEERVRTGTKATTEGWREGQIKTAFGREWQVSVAGSLEKGEEIGPFRGISMFWFGISEKREKDFGRVINWAEGYEKPSRFRKDGHSEFTDVHVTKLLQLDSLILKSTGDERQRWRDRKSLWKAERHWEKRKRVNEQETLGGKGFF